MAHLKITFWQKKIDRASKGSKRHLLDHICARTFQGLHSVRLWTPTIFRSYQSNINAYALYANTLRLRSEAHKHVLLLLAASPK
jgi:hypothetical protein